jgi:hypothetical protein
MALETRILVGEIGFRRFALGAEDGMEDGG